MTTLRSSSLALRSRRAVGAGPTAATFHPLPATCLFGLDGPVRSSMPAECQ